MTDRRHPNLSNLFATLEEVLEALRVKYGLTVKEARTSLKRDARLSLTDHVTEVKRLVEAAYTDLPQTHTDRKRYWTCSVTP